MALPKPEPGGKADETLRLVAEQACALSGCVAAGLTVVWGEDPAVVLGTSLLGRQLEQAQWDASEGPGLDAIRQLQVFNVSCLVTTSSWPRFIPLALGRGVRSSLAVPIILGGRALGALDLYSLEPAAFDGAEQVGLHFAGEAALVLSDPGPRAAGGPGPSLRAHGPGRSVAVN